MSLISINNLTFTYEGSCDEIFSNVSFQIDTDWKLGFCGRNGRGKTTFLKLLTGDLDYSGTILCSAKFVYFPFDVKNKHQMVYELAEEIVPGYEVWMLEKELNLLKCPEGCIYRTFETLSGGEQTKVLLAILFLKDDSYLLIDEPTNHLDAEARQAVSNFLNTKKSFILVSHDRAFLDGCIDHVLSINKTNIDIQSGNFSDWLMNKERIDNFEIAQNKKLVAEVKRLKEAARQKSSWSSAAENKVIGAADKGFMSHKAAKQMKTAKIIERRQAATIEAKSKLLKNIETTESLSISPISHPSKLLVDANNLSIKYGDRVIFKNVSFSIKEGDRVLLVGGNGSGKTTLLNLIAGVKREFIGGLSLAANLKISYVPQDTSNLTGSLKEYAIEHEIDESLLKSILVKLGFERIQFEKNMEDYSAGQKKKVHIARSLCEKAHLYIWDEPLNYIDIISRMQIENLILNSMPTMIFVEHDQAFASNIATQISVIK